MEVRVIKGFVGHYFEDGERKQINKKAGDVFELPSDVDWLNAGLVEPIEPPSVPPKGGRRKPRRKAVRSTGEKAVVDD